MTTFANFRKLSTSASCRLSAESIREVEQKDIQVRLQEIFRDRNSSIEVTKKNMETHYEHMLQVVIDFPISNAINYYAEISTCE